MMICAAGCDGLDSQLHPGRVPSLRIEELPGPSVGWRQAAGMTCGQKGQCVGEHWNLFSMQEHPQALIGEHFSKMSQQSEAGDVGGGMKATRVMLADLQKQHDAELRELKAQYERDVDDARAEADNQLAKALAAEEAKLNAAQTHSADMRKERQVHSNQLAKAEMKMERMRSQHDAAVGRLEQQHQKKMQQMESKMMADRVRNEDR